MSPATTLETFFDDFAAHANTSIPDLAVLVSPDLDALALLLVRIRFCKYLLGMAEQEVEDELVKVMPGKTYEVNSLGMIEMHTGASRKGWDKEALTDALVHSIASQQPNLMDADTGEVVNLLDFVRDLVTMTTDAATPSWKVTGLRKYGIDPDQYCETTWGRKTITTPKLEEMP